MAQGICFFVVTVTDGIALIHKDNENNCRNAYTLRICKIFYIETLSGKGNVITDSNLLFHGSDNNLSFPASFEELRHRAPRHAVLIAETGDGGA